MNPSQINSNQAVLQEIIQALKDAKSFCFTGHKGPDADVIGSQLALRSLLLQFDPQKKIDIYNYGKAPETLSYLPDIDQVKDTDKVEGNYDVLVVFECSGADRTGNIIDFKTQVKKVINIDHHLHNPNFGHINFVEPTTSSTAELIYKIFKAAQKTPSKEEAICMYTGIVADTGFFKYGNTSPQTHEIAARLIDVGVPVAEITERFLMSRSIPSMKLIGWVIQNTKLHYDNQLATVAIPVKIFEELNASSDDLEDVVNFGLMMKETKASALLKEKEDGLVKISLRSKNNWDVNQVARKFNGGGHKNASGCAFKGSLEEAEKKIVKELGLIF